MKNIAVKRGGHRNFSFYIHDTVYDHFKVYAKQIQGKFATFGGHSASVNGTVLKLLKGGEP